MNFELLTIPGCPNTGPALEMLRQVLAAEGWDTEQLTAREVTSQNQADELQFHGSPSFTADGHDLFPVDSAPALSCRLYRTGQGVAGIPSGVSLATAVRRVTPNGNRTS